MELLTAADPYLKRRDRALELLEAQPHASEMLMLYVALLDAWQPALARVRNDPPGSGGLASAAVREILPAVLDATQSAGPALLREAVLGRFHEADLEALVERWLAGGELSPTDQYLARAPVGGVVPITGLMTMPPIADDPEASRRYFARSVSTSWRKLL